MNGARAGEDPAAYTEFLRRRGPALLTLPERDDAIEAMPAAQRRRVGETWHRRAHEELKAAMAFSLLSRELLEIGAAPEAMARIARAVSDEVRHAEILRALASRYLGEEARWPPAVPIDADAGRLGARPREQASLHAVSLCCVNETIAAVFIEAGHAAATCPSARATLGLILADEVEHGRAGWIYLAGVAGDDAVRATVQQALVSIVRKDVECWFDFHAITLPEGVPEHGLIANADTRRCVATALRELVLPGFAQLGFDVTDAARLVDGL